MRQTLSPDVSRKLANMGFVCACLVVGIHVGLPEAQGMGRWVARLLKEGICRIAVPFFFVAAGYFLAGHMGEPGWWRRETGKRMRSVLVPYVLWSLLWAAYGIPFALVANRLAGAGWTRNLPLSGGEWLHVLGLDLYRLPNHYPLWFLRCLLLLVVLSPLSVAVVRRGRGWGIALVAALWAVYGWGSAWRGMAVEGTPLHFWWGTLSLEGVFYFTLGLFLRRWPMSVRLPTWGAWGMLAGALGGFVATFWAQANAFWWAPYPRWMGIAGGLWAVWRLMPAAPWPGWLTGAAFPLYLSHLFVLMALSIAVKHLPFVPNPTEGLAGYLAFWGVAIVTSVAATWALRRLFPRTAGILFGGR